MPKTWILLDYLAANGRNVIHEWLNGLPVTAKAAINSRLRYLEATRPLQGGKLTKVLTGGYRELVEIRIPHKGVQYRPLSCFGPTEDNITLLVGAREKGDRFEPRDACDTAMERRANIHTRGHTCEHNYS